MNTKKKAGGLGFNPLLQSTEEIETTSTHTDTSTSEHADTQASRQEDVPASTHTDTSTSMPVHVPTRVPADTQTTSKFTFYFTQEQLDRLDQVWSELRRKRRGTGQQRVSKSQIVRVALDKLLDDFERDPEETIRLLLNRLG